MKIFKQVDWVTVCAFALVVFVGAVLYQKFVEDAVIASKANTPVEG